MGLLDRFKKAEARPPESGFVEIGSTALKESGGVVQEEFLRQLSGQKAMKIYREMGDNDPIVGALLFLFDVVIKQVPWVTVAADDSNEAAQWADFLESVMNDMSHPFGDVISEALTMLQYGFDWQEIVYKYRNGPDGDPRSKFNDGLIGWRKFGGRSQDSLDSWVFDENGGIQGMKQLLPDGKVVMIPIEKSVLFRTVVRKNNPEGRSILRNAYRPYYFKKRIEEIEAIGVERDLAGYPTIGVPRKYLTRSATAEERQTVEVLRRIITGIKRDRLEGLVRPIEYDEHGNEKFPFALLSTGGRRPFDTNAIINRYEQRIAMSVLADFILLGHEKVGSFALAEAKDNLFVFAVNAVLDNISDVLNRFAVEPLMQINGVPVELHPRIEYQPVKEVPVETISKVLSDLSNSGASIFPDERLENAVLRRLGLPEKTPSSEL